MKEEATKMHLLPSHRMIVGQALGVWPVSVLAWALSMPAATA